MVHCVIIDSAYDGELFNVTLRDVSETEDALVTGTHNLPAPEEQTTVAIKIIDMLGEEVLGTEQI